jgi:hypothetical protein
MADMQHSFTVVAEVSARDIELALSSDVLGSLADVPVSFVMGRRHADFERPAATLRTRSPRRSRISAALG